MPISLYLVATQDFAWLIVAVPAYALLGIASRYLGVVPAFKAGRRVALSLALIVVGLVWIGKGLVYHDFALSMDEFMMRWQSQLLLYGKLLAPAPDTWWPLSSATRPGFLIIDPEYRIWAPGYRPGTAVLHAAFSKFGLGGLMNALFAGAAVLILWRLGRRLFPDDAGAQFSAIFLFATSAQFLITAMTPYTMTAHLLASLLWVWLFTIDRPWSHALAIALGCYALGLHHVHVHSFMAMPFLLHLLVVRRRWRLFLAYAASYSVAGFGWIFWMDAAIWFQGLPRVASGSVATVNGDLGFVELAVDRGLDGHGAIDLLFWASNLTRLVAWQNLAVVPLALIALWHFRTMPIILRLMAWSVATSLIPYVLLMPSQGHGWGYRYLHHIIGFIALLAGYGWSVALLNGRDRTLRFAVLLGGFSCFVALPMRAVQTEAVVRPFAATVSFLKAQPADVVLISTEDIWYGRDLVRNDPLLRNRPVILALEIVPDTELARLCAEQKVVHVGNEQLRAMGMVNRVDKDGARLAHEMHNLARLEGAGCGR